MEQLTDTLSYAKSLMENRCVRILCALIYVIMLVSGVTLYAMLPHKPNLVGLFVMTLIFAPFATGCLWYVITHERYEEFEFNKKITKIFNPLVFISIPLNHFLLMLNSAIAYANPDMVNADAIAYTFVTLGWTAIAAVLLTITGIQIYGIYLVIGNKCRACYDQYKSRSNIGPDAMEEHDPEKGEAQSTQNVLNEASIDNVMQEF